LDDPLLEELLLLDELPLLPEELLLELATPPEELLVLDEPPPELEELPDELLLPAKPLLVELPEAPLPPPPHALRAKAVQTSATLNNHRLRVVIVGSLECRD
jgi:hypothetical protein